MRQMTFYDCNVVPDHAAANGRPRAVEPPDVDGMLLGIVGRSPLLGSRAIGRAVSDMPRLRPPAPRAVVETL